jgi:hypothetical protein
MRNSLRGIGPVRVVIMDDNLVDAEEIGLTHDRLEAEVELQLRRNGVPLTNETTSYPVLYVTVSVGNEEVGFRIFYVTVELHQGVVTMTSTQ